MSGLSLGKSKNQQSEKVSTFTQNAPVQTHVTQPASEEVKETEKLETKSTDIVDVQSEQQGENKYPWRKHHEDTPVDTLWGMKEKKTVEIPLELALRLAFLKTEKKPKRYGERITETSCLIEGLEEYTTKELKKLGYSVK